MFAQGEVHKKVIESSPWDNRAVILSVSIKPPQEPSKGGDNMFGGGTNPGHGGAAGRANNLQSAFRGVSPQINTFRCTAPSNQDFSPGLIKDKQWRSIKIICHSCLWCSLTF